jgi:hypothetical protein
MGRETDAADRLKAALEAMWDADEEPGQTATVEAVVRELGVMAEAQARLLGAPVPVPESLLRDELVDDEAADHGPRDHLLGRLLGVLEEDDGGLGDALAAGLALVLAGERPPADPADLLAYAAEQGVATTADDRQHLAAAVERLWPGRAPRL